MSAVKNLNKRVLWLALILFFFYSPFLIHAEEQSDITIASLAARVNQARVQKGLPKLDVDPRLNQAALAHSERMARHDLLSESGPALGTPFERVRAAGLSDLNSMVVVARASEWDRLREQLDSGDNNSKILSPEMTHLGAGIFTDTNGNQWVTLHMTERAINFTLFTMHQTTGNPVKRSMNIKGNTRHEKIRALLVPPEDSARDTVEQIVVPDSNGDFEIKLSFGVYTGNFGFEFSVFEDGEYKLKNSFNMEIR